MKSSHKFLIPGKFLINVGSHDGSYNSYVQLFAVGSGSSLSGCGSPAQFPIDIFYQAAGYMNDGTVLSCGGYDRQWVLIYFVYKSLINIINILQQEHRQTCKGYLL